MDDSTFDHTTASVNQTNPLLNLSNNEPSEVSPLEQEVLDEYSRLLGNMNKLSSTLSSLSSGPITIEVAEGLRLLERKVASVYTLMKASVYSIVLQQGQLDGEGDGNDARKGYEGDATALAEEMMDDEGDKTV